MYTGSSNQSIVKYIHTHTHMYHIINITINAPKIIFKASYADVQFKIFLFLFNIIISYTSTHMKNLFKQDLPIYLHNIFIMCTIVVCVCMMSLYYPFMFEDTHTRFYYPCVLLSVFFNEMFCQKKTREIFKLIFCQPLKHETQIFCYF